MMLRLAPYLWYPLILLSAGIAFALLVSFGWSAPAAMYVPIVIAGLTIVLLERRFPERLDWRPTRADIEADAAFLLVVQIILPRALAAVTILTLSAWSHASMPSRWWPHDWPLAAQVVAIVLLVDFVRYWLHRACHRYTILWRLHEVHHSPDLLYTLNVGRFHPVEKILHFSLDTVPFVLLGVDPYALAGYFLLYAVNGFFQHSNIRLRYGWLNYLVGSAETHRWHHARDPKTASCNFGNTTIVWDLVFRTWYLPTSGPVDDIGIPNRSYPKGFWQQMAAPFRPFLQGTAKPGRRHAAANLFMRIFLELVRRLTAWRIRNAAQNPMAVQNALLKRILRTNRNTRFGHAHRFAAIDSYADYAERIPVCEIEALRPFIDSEIAEGVIALTAQPPIRYLRTSGTTGRAKDIPVVQSHLSALRRIHRAAVARQYQTCPEAFSGSILAIVSPAEEGWLANGKPYGAASGLVAGTTPQVLLDKFVVPGCVLTVTDSRLKYLLILRLALRRQDITYIGTANPSTLLTLMRLYREHERDLVDDLDRGTFFLADQLPAAVRSAVESHWQAQPRRAAELDALSRHPGSRRIADLWPALRLVVTWTCASAGIAAAALRHDLHPKTRIMELGYLSSEFRGTITLGKRPGSGFPTLDTHFFEFVEHEKWDTGRPEYLTLTDLRKGIDYYIVVTTPSGLYRYFINDLVKVRGFLHQTPLLQFLQKGKGVTSITGEKLYESQVIEAVRVVMQEAACALRFMMVLADEHAGVYRVYVEPDGKPPGIEMSVLARHVDAKLQELNIEYGSKRESGRLAPLEGFWLTPGTYERYKEHCVAGGQREGQFKTVALSYRRLFGFNLDACVESYPNADTGT